MPGLPKAIIKKYGISKKAWEIYKHGTPYTKGGYKKTTRKGSGKSMVKRRSYKRAGRWIARRKQKTTIPVSIVVPLIASVFSDPKPGWGNPAMWIQAVASGQMQYSKNLADCLLNGWLFTDSTGKVDLAGGSYTKMMIVGAAVHWVAGKLGINRAIAKTKIPYIRI